MMLFSPCRFKDFKGEEDAPLLFTHLPLYQKVSGWRIVRTLIK
jgi:hypothetical protein